ncbi:lysophospholipid acyltransferase family protein [Boudabousia marimammalium]|uniref:Phospholipid/glycerol acyltransferase domain-containing protein n=1 Tax=Boudabousia marimammalium TaxID=156892 RepID=A0A1Q5PP47_9ACTO|nr:lysophospholipid acyltransferase family protein [Boudabousia marimammalium]OKL49361.1 hypothetical protein BM477_05135 [Boudabousia marimammalium]
MRKFSPVYRASSSAVAWVLRCAVRTRWEGLENLPAEGGYVVAANHMSELDGLTLMHPLIKLGIPVRVLSKASLFKVPVLGWLMKQAGQVPVYRDSGQAGDALKAAKQALADGEVIAIFPEGTLTRDPQYWPMTAKTGVGRLALAGDSPVIPVAQWGAQHVLGRYEKFPDLRGRKTVTVRFGEAVDVSDLKTMEDTHRAARIATDRVMDAITEMLADIRGEAAPATRYDMREDGDPGKAAFRKQSGEERKARHRR